METKKKIIINGTRVIDIGYRLFLLEEAQRRKIAKLDMKNFEENETQKQRVEVWLGDNNKEKIDEFINWITSNKPEESKVDKDGIVQENYTGDIISIDEYYKIFNISQLSKMAISGRKLYLTQNKMLETQNKMLETQNKMLERQSDISDSIKETVNVQKEMLIRIERFSLFGKDVILTQEDIKNKIDEIRKDLKGYIDKRIGDVIEIVKKP